MRYNVLLRAPAAERDRRKLPADTGSRVNTALLALELDPRPPNVAKLAGSTDLWRLRVGDYRILFAIDDGATRSTSPSPRGVPLAAPRANPSRLRVHLSRDRQGVDNPVHPHVRGDDIHQTAVRRRKG